MSGEPSSDARYRAGLTPWPTSAAELLGHMVASHAGDETQLRSMTAVSVAYLHNLDHAMLLDPHTVGAA